MCTVNSCRCVGSQLYLNEGEMDGSVIRCFDRVSLMERDVPNAVPLARISTDESVGENRRRGPRRAQEGDDSTAPLSPHSSPKRKRTSGMARVAQQMRLLTWKNVIVMRRSILWTLVQVVSPLIFFLLIYVVSHNAITNRVPGHMFPTLTLNGTIDDFVVEGCPMQCNNFPQKQFVLLYSIDRGVDGKEAKTMMDGINEGYGKGRVTVRVESIDGGRKALEDKLRKDYDESSVCKQTYIGGIHIVRLNTGKTFEYEMWFPSNSQYRLSSDYASGSSPFVYPGSDATHQPHSLKPFCDSGLLSLQIALNRLFAKLPGAVPISARAFPQPRHSESSMESLLGFSYFLFALMIFSVVLHTVREIASEKETGMKDYLMVMGMGRGVFYSSHILLAFLKSAIGITINCIPFFMTLPLVSPTLLLVTVLLYSLCLISLGALVAACFKSANTALKGASLCIILLTFLAIVSPNREDITLSFIAALNPNLALSYAFQAFTEALQLDSPLGWTTIFAGSQYVFTAGYALIMLLVDFIILLSLTLAVDWLLSSTDSPLSRFTRFVRHTPLNRTVARSLEGGEETDSNLVDADIDVTNVVKAFHGMRAVDELSFKAYRGQITVLLGHNGAGKSTTFNMIAGLTSPTRGQIRICDMDISTRLAECQERIGYCPQGNPLFNLLTVDEHLEFFASLKGIESAEWEKERNDLVSSLKLCDKRSTRAGNLSGGMKRKLCVGMALIGQNKVILLDEPTAGIDSAARREMEELLQRYKRNSSILMTTHYTDEAEQLGERIVIMAHGRVATSGTPAFLKHKYGTGYILTVVESEKNASNEERIMAMITQEVEGAYVKNTHGQQMEICLPKEEYERFPRLFERLERHGNELGMTSFGLSLNTLEHVFIRVGELVDGGNKTAADAQMQQRVRRVLVHQDSLHSPISSPFYKLRFLLLKRFVYCKAHWTAFISQYLVPIAIIFLTANLLELMNVSSSQSKDLTLGTLPSSRFVLFKDTLSTDFYDRLENRVKGMKKIQTETVSSTTSPDEWYMREKPRRPPVSTGVATQANTTLLMHSEVFLQSLPSLITIVDEALLNVDIDTVLHLYTWEGRSKSEGVSDDMVKATLAGPILVILLSLLTSPFVTFPILDRNSKFAHQQLLTGVSPLLLWTANLIFDFGLFLIGSFLFLIAFVCTDWLVGYLSMLFLLWIAFFFASIFLIYSFSFIFDSPSKGQIILFFFQVIITLMAFLFTTLIDIGFIAPASWQDVVEGVILILVPSFALCRGGFVISRSKMAPPGIEIDLWEWDQMGRIYTYLLIMGTVSCIVFCLIQVKRIRRAFFCLWNIVGSGMRGRVRNGDEEGQEEDKDVIEERNRMKSVDIASLPLATVDLTKDYGRMRALDSLTLGLSPQQCFGLLGVNGAGKTTTFSIITGETFPTAGEAFIYGVNVNDSSVSMGYCPQVDALLPEFTGKQTLEIIGGLRGVRDVSGKADIVLQAVGLKDHANVEIGKYSGGQRRKLSVGVAILANNKLIILDEPTAGIDPKARRDIQDVLMSVRDEGHSALLLISHSMDECESLCSRIAVLAKGKMVAIGTSQALKSKYGNSFTLTLVLGERSMSKENVLIVVNRVFPGAKLKPTKSQTLIFEIKRDRDCLWSTAFSLAIEVYEETRAKDFCLTQSSLEQTFMHIALAHERSEEPSEH